MGQGRTYTRPGSGLGLGSVPGSAMAGTPEGIALAEAVALAGGMAGAVGVVSAEDIAEGIANSPCPSLSALGCVSPSP